MLIVKNCGIKSSAKAYPLMIPYSLTIKSFEYPTKFSMFISTIGSRKWARLPTILLLVLGTLIFMMSLMYSFFGFISSFDNVIPLGKPKSITIMLDVSLTIFTKIITEIVSTKLFSISIGIKKISIVILTICSTMFERIYTPILCLPQ